MSDPLTGGASKVAEQMLKEVQTAMSQADQLSQNQAPQGVQFDQVMQAREVGAGQDVTQTQSASNVLRMATQQAQNTPAVPAIGRAIDTGQLKNGLQRIVQDVLAGQNKMEKIVNLAMSGRQFSSSELLALQAGVYRFTQELELTSKVIEKGTSAIKQTLNTQV